MRLWADDKRKGFDYESGVSVTNPVTPTTANIPSTSRPTEIPKYCKRCNQYGHSRVTSRLCKYYTPKGSKTQQTEASNDGSVEGVTIADDSQLAIEFSQISQLTVEGKTLYYIRNVYIYVSNFAITMGNFGYN